GVHVSSAPSAAETQGGNAITLTGKALTQLAFGYRPPAWFAGRSDQQIEAAMVPLLDVLFPPRRGWVAGSDSF
ncbi:sterol carrier protein domain-containing protein, partial [Candidatus Kaiserbacteria bacterium]|nr:sterol carrier protein domain-containing protein [Candidatus Kaiserbacteria bacterium]